MNNSISISSMIIEAPIEKVWHYFSTPQGWNNYLSDVSKFKNSSKKVYDEVEKDDQIEIIIGELTNYSTCIEINKPHFIKYHDHFIALFPNGDQWPYQLITKFHLESFQGMTKVSVIVEGYTEDEMMQWVRECSEMGWTQSLFNLKCIIELGLDLRNEIFNYPRLGVFNYTATEEQLQQQGLVDKKESGNFLKTVYPDGPAGKAGLSDGDIITHLNDIPVPTYKDLVRVLSFYYNKDGDIGITYYRNGKKYKTITQLTYDDQFTGMIDPEKVSLEEVAAKRKKSK